MGNLNYQDVIRDVHDPVNHALQTVGAAGSSTVYIGTPTLYAVVNTGAANSGNITLNPSPNFIGIVTIANSQANTGNVTLNGGPNQIGSVTVSNPITIGNAMVTVTLGTKLDSTNDSVSLPANTTVIPGSAWTDPKTYIGLVTATLAGSVNTGMTTIFPGPNFIGLTTSVIGSAPTLFAVVNTAAAGQASVVLDNSIANIGFATVNVSNLARTITGNLTLSDSKTYIGLTSVSGSVDLNAGANYVGLVTAVPSTTVRSIVGNLTLSDSKTYIGLISVSGSVGVNAGANYIGLVTAVPSTTSRSIAGNLTLSDSKTYIGLVSVSGTVGLAAGANFVGIVTVANPSSFAGNITLDPGSKTGIAGNITLSDSKTYVGLVSVSGTVGLAAGVAGIGFSTVNVAAIAAGANYIGLVTAVPSTTSRSIAGNLTLSDSKGYIGLTSVSGTVGLAAGVAGIGFATVNQVNQPALVAGAAYIGLASVNIGGTLPALTAGTTFIGLVTAWGVNSGTSKTLVNLPIGFSAASVVTIAVPTNANSVKITNLVLNSDATVRITLKSGVTYLTGNASIGVTLNPGGGWIQTGSPDSPTWIGLPSGALVIEKLDLTATAAKLAGNVVYFQE